MTGFSDSEIGVLLHRADLKYRALDLNRLAPSGSCVVVPRDTGFWIVAPHSTPTTRNGVDKLAEFYTGAVAEVLGLACGATVVTALGCHETEDADNPITTILRGFAKLSAPRLVVEVHGMARRDLADVDLVVGTGWLDRAIPGAANDFLDHLGGHLRVTLNDPFVGSRAITRRLLDELSVRVPFLHLELSPSVRAGEANGFGISMLAAALTAIDR